MSAHDEFTALNQFKAELLAGCRRMPGSAERELADPGLRAVLDRFAAALEGGDVAALAALVRDDVALETPPLATWFSGREAALGYVAAHLCPTAGRIRLVPTAANGQPAFAAYLGDADGACRAHAIIVLSLAGPLITRIVIFLEPDLFRLFGLDRKLVPGQPGQPGDRGPPAARASIGRSG